MRKSDWRSDGGSYERIEAGHRAGAAARSEDAGQKPDGGRFARTGRTEEAEDLALGHVERDAVDGDETAEPALQVPDRHGDVLLRRGHAQAPWTGPRRRRPRATARWCECSGPRALRSAGSRPPSPLRYPDVARRHGRGRRTGRRSRPRAAREATWESGEARPPGPR